MSTIRSFTDIQEELLIQLGKVHPEQWLRDEREFLKTDPDLDGLKARRTQLLEHQDLLLGFQATLPPKHLLHEYVTTVDLPYNKSHQVVLVSTHSEPELMELPGDDTAASIKARYETLERLIAISKECVDAVDARLAQMRNAVALPDVVRSTISTLPLLGIAEQSALIEVFIQRRGTIVLAEYAKKDACFVLDRLHVLLSNGGLPLSPDERRQMHIVCKDAEFDWYGSVKKGSRERDQVRHIASQITTKPAALVEQWLEQHPE